MDAQRELLDQLMGTARDGDRDERKFNDKNICKHFLCGLSPYDLFRNSKAASFLDGKRVPITTLLSLSLSICLRSYELSTQVTARTTTKLRTLNVRRSTTSCRSLLRRNTAMSATTLNCLNHLCANVTSR